MVIMPFQDITEIHMGVTDLQAEIVVQLLKELQEKGRSEKGLSLWRRPVEGRDITPHASVVSVE